VQPLKILPRFYETRSLITLFTRAIHLSLSWARWIQSMPLHPISLWSILILSTQMRLGLTSGLFFFFGFRIKLQSSSPHSCYMPCQSLPSWLYHSYFIWRGVQFMNLLIIQLPPISRHYISLRSKYSPQHPVLKHPQSLFLPYCQRPSFTPIQNNMQNYTFVYSNLFTFLNGRREHKRFWTEWYRKQYQNSISS
jgi:hypothetical protein